jgi:ankyrin repeat protein
MYEAIIDNKYEQFMELLGSDTESKCRNATQHMIHNNGMGIATFHYTPLTLASREQQYHMIECMLKIYGLDVNHVNYYGDTALHSLIKSVNKMNITNSKKSLQLLLSHDAVDVNLSNKEGVTPLILAVTKKTKHISIVKILLEHQGIDANVSDSNGFNALMHCVDGTQHSLNCVRAILQMRNIDMNAKNKKGETALVIAINYVNNLYNKSEVLLCIRQLLNYRTISIDDHLQKCDFFYCSALLSHGFI